MPLGAGARGTCSICSLPSCPGSLDAALPVQENSCWTKTILLGKDQDQHQCLSQTNSSLPVFHPHDNMSGFIQEFHVQQCCLSVLLLSPTLGFIAA